MIYPIVYVIGVIIGFILVGLTDWFGTQHDDPCGDPGCNPRSKRIDNEFTQSIIFTGVFMWPAALPFALIILTCFAVGDKAISWGKNMRKRWK